MGSDHPMLHEIETIVAGVRTEGEASHVRTCVRRLRDGWRDQHPAWRTDPLANSVDQAFCLTLDRLDELIACHGHC